MALSSSNQTLKMPKHNTTVSGQKFEEMRETSQNLQHLGIRMMHDLNARRKYVEEAYARAIDAGLESGLPFDLTDGSAQQVRKITTDINTPYLPKAEAPNFTGNDGLISPHPKSPKLIKISNTFNTFSKELSECSTLYSLPAEHNDVVLNASSNVIKFNKRLDEQIRAKPLLIPLKVSPIKRRQKLQRARTSIGGSRRGNGLSRRHNMMHKNLSLPNLHGMSTRPRTTPVKRGMSQTTAAINRHATISLPSDSTIFSRRNKSKTESLDPVETIPAKSNEEGAFSPHVQNRLTWQERMAKRDLKKCIDDYTARKRQWGKILKGELSAMNTIAKQTILERKKKWLMLIYMVKMPFFLEAPLAESREERAAQRAMVEASIRMQSLFRGSFARRTHSKLTKVQELLLKRLWIVRLNLSTSKRKKAAHLVRKFCKDYASTSQFKTILKKYRWRVIYCQRTIRSFLVCKRARLKLLRKIWMKYEMPIAKEMQAKHIQMIKDSLRKQLEQRKERNSLENQSRDGAVEKKKQKEMEKLFKANKSKDEQKRKQAMELMLLVRRCKGLTKVLEAKKNGDMKATINAAMINKMANGTLANIHSYNGSFNRLTVTTFNSNMNSKREGCQYEIAV